MYEHHHHHHQHHFVVVVVVVVFILEWYGMVRYGIRMTKIILYKRLRCLAKGNRVNIPEPRHGDSHFGGKCGNANRPGDVAKSPGKSCLFFVRCQVPGIGLTGDRDSGTVKHRGSCGVQCTLGNP